MLFERCRQLFKVILMFAGYAGSIFNITGHNAIDYSIHLAITCRFAAKMQAKLFEVKTMQKLLPELKDAAKASYGV